MQSPRPHVSDSTVVTSRAGAEFTKIPELFPAAFPIKHDNFSLQTEFGIILNLKINSLYLEAKIH